MKDAFRQAMRAMWPDGVKWGSHMHRDVIRVFVMGWIEGLRTAGGHDELRRFFDEYGGIADMNWWPDETWRW